MNNSMDTHKFLSGFFDKNNYLIDEAVKTGKAIDACIRDRIRDRNNTYITQDHSASRPGCTLYYRRAGPLRVY